MERVRNEPPADADRVNDLYWASERTVDEIVADLAIGRSTLYAALEPLQIGVLCECGGTFAFANRMSRSAGRAFCLDCGAEQLADLVEVIDAEARAARPADEPEGDGRARRALGVGGATVLGVAAGAAAAWTIRKQGVL